jgi:serine/threonine-protein phosphatase 6 regulatory ankyrin repeat subunit B
VIDARDIFGNTALIYAVGAGHLEAASLLLRQGADITLRKPNGMTVLDIAASREHERLFPLLLRERFFAAARLGEFEMLAAILDEGVDVNARSFQGWTALMMAAVNGHLDATRILLNAGADLNAQDERGWDALSLAVRQGHEEIAHFLKQHRPAASHLRDVSNAA